MSSSSLFPIPPFRPWLELIDLSSISLPPSTSEATTRVLQNLTHFLPNYILISLALVFLRLLLLSHPAAALVSLLLSAAALLLLRRPSDPIDLPAALSVSPAAALAALGIAAAVVFVWSGVVWNVVVSGLIAGFVVCLHGLLRCTDDLVSDSGDAEGLVASGDGDGQGTYTIL